MKSIKSIFMNEFDLQVEKPEVFKLAKTYFNESYDDLVASCDRVFAFLMVFQWFFSIGIALWFSPYTYIGTQAEVHYHVWLAVFGGGILAVTPVALHLLQPKNTMNRYVNVISQGLFSALLIHLMGGRIETHFHVFGSLAFFAFYRDLKVLAVGTLVVAVDHLIRGIWFPVSAFGTADVSQWRWLEHAAWVVFEDFFLSYACIKSLQEMKIVALKRAETEDQKNSVEEIVRIRTAELSDERNGMKTVLDTIDQSLFTVNLSGIICGEPSKKSFEFLNKSELKNMKFAEALGKTSHDFDDLFRLIQSGDLHHDSCIELLPQRLNVGSRILRFSYKPILNNDQLSGLLVAASDVTEIERLQEESRQAEERNRSIVKILTTKNEFIEAVNMVNELESMLQDPLLFKRQLHTLKGSFAFLECSSLAQHCHHLENNLPKDVQDFSNIAGQVYADLKIKVDAFIKTNNHILKLNSDHQSVEIQLPLVSQAIKRFKQIDPSMSAVAEFDELLKVDLSEELSWLSDAFKQSCEKLGKESLPISFDSKTKIPTHTYKSLFKSFVHVVRNAADHGLEDPAEREMLGKNPAGSLKIQLLETDSFYEIIFKDDGRGVDIQRLRNKLGAAAQGLSDEDVLDTIFNSGISTKDTVTETSGRGVGLDAVRYEAKKLDGRCWAVNSDGEGLEIHVKFKKLNFSDASEVLIEKAA